MANDHAAEMQKENLIPLAQYSHVRNRLNVIVLLIGRWSERLPILRVLVESLEAMHYIPVAFDLDRCKNMDVLVTLARMSRCLLLDLTSVPSLALRLRAMIHREAMTVQPLLDSSDGEKERMQWTVDAPPWVLPVYFYDGCVHLSETVKAKVIEPLEESVRW